MHNFVLISMSDLLGMSKKFYPPEKVPASIV